MKKYIILSLLFWVGASIAADHSRPQYKGTATASALPQSNHAIQRGGMCVSHHSRITGADLVWHCEYLGRVTIKQIYEQAFRVATVYTNDPADPRSQFQYLIIEEQRR